MKSTYLLLPVVMPLLSFLLVGCLGKILGKIVSNVLAVTIMIVACVSSLLLLHEIIIEQKTIHIVLAQWFTVAQFKANWSVYLDSLSSIMIIVINAVSALVHVYAVDYMRDDENTSRFMAYLSFFTFMMLILVTAGDLVQMFCGWEGVGLASYLLIGYWHKRPRANYGAIKAFLVNRCADIGFVTAIAVSFIIFKSCDMQYILNVCSDYTGYILRWNMLSFNIIELIGILFFIAAMAKSAQIGLHIWLADAMEGPTPVSALLHAATMVTAGIFLLARLSPLYEFAPHCRNFITIIGITTSIFGASMALVQYDIKKAIAYSTCSQLGYMVMACGLSLYNLAIFHLVTHAFFKALLFLGAGSVIHFMEGEQDIRKMGGLAKYMPLTCALMCIGALALAGIPFFSGFYSKDAILIKTWSMNTKLGLLAFWIGNIVALATAIYIYRLLYRVFAGSAKSDHHIPVNAHESGPTMLISMIVLGAITILLGYIIVGYFDHESLLTKPGSIPLIIHICPVIFSIGGLGLSAALYIKFTGFRHRIKLKFRWITSFLEHKWYFEELYQELLIKNLRRLGSVLWHKFDLILIDKILVLSIAKRMQELSSQISIKRSGHLSHYIINTVIAVVVVVAWLLYLVI